MIAKTDQIKTAMKLLQPADPASARKILIQATKEIEAVRRENQRMADLYEKTSRKALKEFRQSIARADVTYKKLPKEMKFIVDHLNKRNGRTPFAFDAVKRDLDAILNAPYRRSRVDYVKLNAVAWAWNIFGLLDLDNPPLTKRGKWPKLAAILSGSKGDLYHHCQLYRDGMSSGQK